MRNFARKNLFHRARNGRGAFMIRAFLLGLCLLLPAGVGAAQEASEESILKAQWWTGPLVAPSPAPFAEGVLGVEPYVLDKRGDGAFDDNGTLHASPPGGDQLKSFVSLQYGVTGDLGVQIVPAIVHSLNGGAATGLADLPVRVKYRIFRGHAGFWHPQLNLVAGVILPIGRYDDLRKSSDGFGSGAVTAMQQAMLQTVFVTQGHANRMRLWGTVSEPLDSVRLQGVSTYGTGAGFDGMAVLGNSAEIGIADEFAINQRWVLALDMVQDFGKGTHLRAQGYSGAILNVATSGFSVAPAVEYNFSQAIGVIAGAQISTIGRNSSSTIIPQVAVNMFF
jgi:hypothetical protein